MNRLRLWLIKRLHLKGTLDTDKALRAWYERGIKDGQKREPVYTLVPICPKHGIPLRLRTSDGVEVWICPCWQEHQTHIDEIRTRQLLPAIKPLRLERYDGPPQDEITEHRTPAFLR